MSDHTKDQLIGALDQANHHFIAARHDRTQWMVHLHRSGVPFSEIADILGITESGARKAVHRAVTDGQG